MEFILNESTNYPFQKFQQFLKEKQKLVFNGNKIEFLGKSWTFFKFPDKLVLFLHDEPDFFRAVLRYQQSLRNIVGEIRIRQGENLYEHLFFLRSSSECENLFEKVEEPNFNIAPRIFQLALREFMPSNDKNADFEASLELSALLQKPLRYNTHNGLDKRHVQEQQELRNLFVKLGFEDQVDNYLASFGKHKVDISQLHALTAQDLAVLVDIIGDRIRLQEYLKKENVKN